VLADVQPAFLEFVPLDHGRILPRRGGFVNHELELSASVFSSDTGLSETFDLLLKARSLLRFSVMFALPVSYRLLLA
jgi:hypothetical protein